MIDLEEELGPQVFEVFAFIDLVSSVVETLDDKQLDRLVRACEPKDWPTANALAWQAVEHAGEQGRWNRAWREVELLLSLPESKSWVFSSIAATIAIRDLVGTRRFTQDEYETLTGPITKIEGVKVS